jgi:hypothetical protein
MGVRYLGCCVVLAGLAIAGPGAAGRTAHKSCVHAMTPVPARPTGDRLLAIGVPKGQVGPIAKAGYVVVTYGGNPENRRVISQASPGIPGDPKARGLFGSAVASGDFDHDGHPDLSITAPDDGTGSVTLVFGSADGPSGQAVTLTAPAHQRCEAYGREIAVGDFDADRFDDVAIACASGTVQIIHGGPGLRTSVPDPAYVDSGSEEVTKSGGLAAGDLTGDGYADLIVESGIDDPADAGFDINVIAGSAHGLTHKVGRTAKSMNAAALAVGDVDRDGHADLVTNGIGNSEVIVFPGTAQGLDTRGLYKGTRGLARRHGYINSIAVGDVNGDGYADTAFGSAEGLGGISAGSVTVLYGAPGGLSGARAQRIRQGENGVPGKAEREDGMGGPVVLTDLNGDGHADLAASASLENHGTGAVVLLPGTTAGVGSKGATMLCGAPHTNFGSVLGA